MLNQRKNVTLKPLILMDMAWEKVSSEIEKIRLIVESWEMAGSLNIIEQEIVLDKLRQVYDSVKFAGFGLMAPSVSAGADEEKEPKMEVKAESVEQIHGQEIEEKSGGVSPEAARLAEDIGFHVKPKRDRKTLMSLYGDEAEEMQAPGSATQTPVCRPADEGASERQEGGEMVGDTSLEEDSGEDVLEAMGLSVEEAPQPERVAAAEPSLEPLGDLVAEAPDEGHKRVLGDILQHGETLSDVYARSNPRQDVAGKIMNGKVESIRSSIGINDKFLLIRDLFGGDAELYDRTIRELDSYRELDDAVIFIHDNFRWNPDSDGAKLLMDLLTRKLA